MQNPQASAVIDCHSSMHMLQDEQSTKEKNYLLVTHRFIHDSLSSFFQTLLIHIIHCCLIILNVQIAGRSKDGRT